MMELSEHDRTALVARCERLERQLAERGAICRAVACHIRKLSPSEVTGATFDFLSAQADLLDPPNLKPYRIEVKKTDGGAMRWVWRITEAGVGRAYGSAHSEIWAWKDAQAVADGRWPEHAEKRP